MKKILISLALSTALISSCALAESTVCFSANSGAARVVTDEITDTTCKNPIFVLDGKSYISPADITSFFGINTEKAGAAQANVSLGDKTLLVDGCVQNDGVFYIPLKDACAGLGLDVNYVYTYNKILVSDKTPVATAVSDNGEFSVSADDAKLYFEVYKPQLESENDTSGMKDEILTYLAERENFYKLALGGGFGFNALTAQIGAIKASSDEIAAESSSILPEIAALSLEKDGVVNMYLAAIQTAAAVDETQAEGFYNDNFVSAKHILILSEAGKSKDKKEALKTAETVLKKLKKGEDFDKLMTEYCEDPGIAQNPDGYTFTYGEMVPEFEAAAFALNENEISDIIETSYGYHIIRRLPLQEFSGDLKEAVISYLQQQKYGEYVKSVTGNIKTEKNEDVLNSIN